MGIFETIINPVIGGPVSLYEDYRRTQRHKIGDAYNEAMPTAEEVKLSDSLMALVKQAAADREQTRNLVLAEMGFKTVTGPDGKPSIQPLSNEERKAMMSPAEANRSEASRLYAERAKAAFEGTTELPAFLQKEVSAQEKRKAGSGSAFRRTCGSAAAEQAMAELKKRELMSIQPSSRTKWGICSWA
jgi:hypothetical protein